MEIISLFIFVIYSLNYQIIKKKKCLLLLFKIKDIILKVKLLMNSLIKDNTIAFLTNNNNGNIIMKKLMNSLRMEKGVNYINHS